MLIWSASSVKEDEYRRASEQGGLMLPKGGLRPPNHFEEILSVFREPRE